LLSPEETREVLAAAPGVTVVGDPPGGLYPTALEVAGRDEVLVARIRRNPSHDRCLNLWIVCDKLRQGAATNPVQVAELLAVPVAIHGDRILAGEPTQLASGRDPELAVDAGRVRGHVSSPIESRCAILTHLRIDNRLDLI
jgi:hypothetical protein